MYATRSLSHTFGAEVLDCQLSGSPSGQDIIAIRELWAEHKLLLFRNQSFDEAALVGFSGQFGDLEIHVREEYLSPEHPEILYVSNIEREGRRIGILSDTEVGWHYDQIYLPKPAVGSPLMADTLPPEGGNTEFTARREAQRARDYARADLLREKMRDFGVRVQDRTETYFVEPRKSAGDGGETPSSSNHGYARGDAGAVSCSEEEQLTIDRLLLERVRSPKLVGPHQGRSHQAAQSRRWSSPFWRRAKRRACS